MKRGIYSNTLIEQDPFTKMESACQLFVAGKLSMLVPVTTEMSMAIITSIFFVVNL